MRPHAAAEDLQIAGLVPLSTVDWPGRLAATLFCQGCPWRCAYCHNQAILDPRTPGQVAWSQVEQLLDRRRGLLDAVVLSGGEATMQHAVVPAARAVRERGFAVGLHTGGAFPARIAALLGLDAHGRRTGEKLVDWVGFDLKAPPAGYDAVVGARSAWGPAARSWTMLREAQVPMEVRTTVTPELLPRLEELIRAAARLGVPELVLQRARAEGAPATFAAQLDAMPDWAERFTQAAADARRLGDRLGIAVRVR